MRVHHLLGSEGSTGTGRLDMEVDQSLRCAAPLLHSRRLSLERLAHCHIAAIQVLLEDSEVAGNLSLLASGAAAAEFEKSIWQVSPLQFAMVKRDSREVIGLLQGLNIDDRSRTIGIGAVLKPEVWHQGWPFEGVVLFLNFLFERKGYRKVYFEMSETSVACIEGGMGPWLTKEAVLQRHTRTAEDVEDLFILSLSAESWNSDVVDRIIPSTTASRSSPVVAVR